MDELMAQLLKEKRWKILLRQDAIYERIQRKNMDIMEPLCNLWESLETANKEQDSSVSVNDFIKFVTKSIILVGQTNSALYIALWDRQTYNICVSALDGVLKSNM